MLGGESTKHWVIWIFLIVLVASENTSDESSSLDFGVKPNISILYDGDTGEERSDDFIEKIGNCLPIEHNCEYIYSAFAENSTIR